MGELEATDDSADEGAGLFADVAHPKKRAYLCALSACGITKLAIASAKISRRTINRWLIGDAQFAEKYHEARRIACDVLTDAAIERAVLGLDRLKFDKDGEALRDPRTGDYYTEPVYSDVLLIFMLKKLDPAKFGDKSDELIGKGEQKIVVEFADDFSSNPVYQENVSGIAEAPAIESFESESGIENGNATSS